MQTAESPDSQPGHGVHSVCAHWLCDFGQLNPSVSVSPLSAASSGCYED